MKKELVAISIVFLSLSIMFTGMFLINPKIINNNYSINLPKETLEKNLEEYKSIQQLERYKRELKEQYNDNIDYLNNKFNTMISLLGIAVSVWIGLNIYNILQKSELDNLKQDIEKLSKKKGELEKSIISLKNKSKEDLNKIEIDYKNRFSKLKHTYNQKSNHIDQLTLKLNRSMAELEIETNYIKIKQLEDKGTIEILEFRKYCEKILELTNKYIDIKDNEFLAEIYNKLGWTYVSVATIDERLYKTAKTLLNKALELSEDVFIIESINYNFAELERCIGNTDNAIYYLKQIYEENLYNFHNSIELASELDRRNKDDDLDKAMEYLNEAVDIGEFKAKEHIFKIKNAEGFLNLSMSNEYNRELEKLINPYDKV
ncbi:tetratricopeptide repeat protein [Tepidibacter sp. Z1-5]|uniref:tetratricopeptide repeat protein n=1 Tax=Tepidibacter sp. Z1-5 TaxID=3134138 RepID=UPI0030BB5047